jgi:hypothetical protein
MAEEAFDSSADDDDNDDVSLSCSVSGEFDEPELMLDRVSRVVCGDGATRLRSDECIMYRENMMRDCAFACHHNIPGLLVIGYSFLFFLW